MENFYIGIKLRSGQQVKFFDGSISTPFPKFNKITSRIIKLVDKWLIENCYNVAKNNGDKLVMFSVISDLGNPHQATKDLAESYLSGEYQNFIKSIN